MYEIIKIIIESITKNFSLEWFLKVQKDKRTNEIGTELFLMYSALNNIIVVGHSIIGELKSGLYWLDDKAKSGEADRSFYTHINFNLLQQKINIIQLIASIKRMGLELQVVAPEAFVSLAPLIFGKLSAISILLNFLKYNENPPLLSVTSDKLYKMVEFAILKGKEIEIKSHRDLYPIVYEIECKHRELFYDLFIDEGIDDLSNIPVRQRDIIRSYLEIHKPDQTLKEIEEIAKLIRLGIEKHFSLQDILLNVGDRRSAITVPYIGFMI